MENLPTPLSRVELYLAKACGMDVTVPEQPLSRLEQFLAILAGDTSITMPAPMSLTEQWLAYVLGVTPSPLLAVEGACLIGAQKVDVRYFAVAASMPGATLPEAPQNRAEMYWAHIAGNPPTPGILKYVTGKNFYLTDVVSGIEELQYVKGDTYQQTYSGANLFDVSDTTGQSVSPEITVDSGGWISVTYNNTSSSAVFFNYRTNPMTLNASTSYAIFTEVKSISGAGNLVPVNNGSIDQFVNIVNYSFSDLSSGGVYKATDTAKSDFTGVTRALGSYVRFGAGQSGSVTFRISVIADTSVTPQTFAYQPYTGGIPAPNPDYPQDINVVTGEQTVTVTGKNLFNPDAPFAFSGDSNLTKTIIPTGVRMTCGTTNTSSSAYGFGVFVIGKLSNYIGKKVTLTTNATTSATNKSYVYIGTSNANGGNRSVKSSQNGATGNYNFSISWDVVEDANQYLCVALYTTQNAAITAGDYVDYKNLQLEIGTATPYEPYVTPQSYTIDLGATELCKIGDYQDYIYKSGDDWYVHKGTSNIDLYGGTITSTSYSDLFFYSISGYGALDLVCSHFTGIVDDRILANTTANSYLSDGQCAFRNGTKDRVYFKTTKFASASDMTVWLASNHMLLYYLLATPTDTQITDATLVGQLEALNSAPLPKPTANITVSATGTNLIPYLTIAYYGSDEE